MKKTSPTLTELYQNSQNRTVSIAHRGACGLYPENTALAMQKAIDYGADLIEFDLRLTRDKVPVLLHDYTIDRTSDGTGMPGDYTLEELQKFNFSYFRSIWGERLDKASYAGLTIPTFEDILNLFHDKCCMNIQVYDSSDESLQTICRLYREYDMFDRGFLAMSSFEAAEQVRKIDPEVEVAVLGQWDKRATVPEIEKCKAFGCRFIQPPIEHLTDETLTCCRDLGVHANIFFSDIDTEIRQLIQRGVSGILTNRIDILRETVDSVFHR